MSWTGIDKVLPSRIFCKKKVGKQKITATWYSYFWHGPHPSHTPVLGITFSQKTTTSRAIQNVSTLNNVFIEISAQQVRESTPRPTLISVVMCEEKWHQPRGLCVFNCEAFAFSTYFENLTIPRYSPLFPAFFTVVPSSCSVSLTIVLQTALMCAPQVMDTCLRALQTLRLIGTI